MSMIMKILRKKHCLRVSNPRGQEVLRWPSNIRKFEDTVCMVIQFCKFFETFFHFFNVSMEGLFSVLNSNETGNKVLYLGIQKISKKFQKKNLLEFITIKASYSMTALGPLVVKGLRYLDKN